jgi:hypothetical protein
VTLAALLAAAVLSHAGAKQPTIPSCLLRPVAPEEIVLACGDGNFSLESLRWKGWGAATATAAGVVHENDCKPYCAAGHFHDYPVTVAATALKSCKAGRRQYTGLSWRYTGRRPPGGRPGDAVTLNCTWPKQQ